MTHSDEALRSGEVPRNVLARSLVALAAYVATTLVLFFPLILHLETSVLWQPGDLSSTAANYWAAEQQGKTPFTLTRDQLVYAPEGQVVAPALQIANFVQPAFAWGLKSALGFVGALNLYLLVGFTLTGFVTFMLLDRLGFHPLASFFGGYVFAYSSWQFEQAFFGHIGLNHLWIFPLLVLEFVWFRRSRSFTASVCLGGTLGFSFYLFSYLGLFACLVVALLMLADAAGAAAAATLRRTMPGYLVIGGTAAAALLPALVVRYLEPTGFDESFVREKGQFAGAGPRDYVLPSANHPLLGNLFGQDGWPPHVGESVAFFGWVTIALAAGGAFLAIRRRRVDDPERSFVLRFAVVLAPVAFLMSLPAYETLGSRKVPVPNAAFVIGGFANWWKAYNRFAVLVGFALVILAAYALHQIASSRRGKLVAAMALGVAIFELLPGALVPTWRLDTPSAAVSWLEARPGGIVATYPMVTASDAFNTGSRTWSARTWTALYDQTRHRHPLYAIQSLPPTRNRTIALRLATRNLARPATVRLLQMQGVRFVVVNRTTYRELSMAPPRPARGLRLAARFGDTDIYSVTSTGTTMTVDDLFRRYLTPAVIRGAGFGPDEIYQGAPARWMRQNGALTVANPNPDRLQARFMLSLRGFSNGVARRVELLNAAGRVLGQTVIDTVDQDYELGPFALPEGSSKLVLRVTPGPTVIGGNDQRRTSIFLRSIAASPLRRDLASQLALSGER